MSVHWNKKFLCIANAAMRDGLLQITTCQCLKSRGLVFQVLFDHLRRFLATIETIHDGHDFLNVPCILSSIPSKTTRNCSWKMILSVLYNLTHKITSLVQKNTKTKRTSPCYITVFLSNFVQYAFDFMSVRLISDFFSCSIHLAHIQRPCMLVIPRSCCRLKNYSLPSNWGISQKLSFMTLDIVAKQMGKLRHICSANVQ